jgi:hypothetical protein
LHEVAVEVLGDRRSLIVLRPAMQDNHYYVVRGDFPYSRRRAGGRRLRVVLRAAPGVLAQTTASMGCRTPQTELE